MAFGRLVAGIQGSTAALIIFGLTFAWAEPPSEEVNKRPSSYAPANDLDYQLKYLLDRIESDLKDESKFDRRAKRVVRDANTIAVLSLVMGRHDEDNSMKNRAGAVIKAASNLAAQKSHAEAKAAYEALVASVKNSTISEKIEWKCVGDIEQLMLQVPQLDTSLKSSIKPSRFAASQEKAAGIAATIAAIAQVSMFDDSYCADESDHADWVELCACMRDAAKDIHTAIEDGDADAAARAVKPLTRTCDDCHELFRD